MPRGQKICWVALAAMLAGQSAHAADAIYLGDCERARQVQQQSTISKLIPHRRYEGIQRAQFAVNKSASCSLNTMLFMTLTEKTRSSSTVVFDMVRTDIFYGRETGCVPLQRQAYDYQGTVTFATKLEQRGELCELFIRADWVHTGPNKITDFWNRVISMENGAFVIAQTAAKDGQFWTPLAFTGVN